MKDKCESSALRPNNKHQKSVNLGCKGADGSGTADWYFGCASAINVTSSWKELEKSKLPSIPHTLLRKVPSSMAAFRLQNQFEMVFDADTSSFPFSAKL